jgi:hypothetical protein
VFTEIHGAVLTESYISSAAVPVDKIQSSRLITEKTPAVILDMAILDI